MAKQCNKCNVVRELKDFQRDKRNADGLQGICSPCKNKDKQVRRDIRATQGDYKIVESKTCNKCGETKTIDLFFKDKAMIDGHSTVCKGCKRETVYAWRETNRDKYNASQRAYQKTADPEKRYGAEIKRRYGCTLERYNEMLTSQGGACAICKSLHNPVEKKGRLYVDHCHETGNLRSLLCKHCNSMLGYAKDNTRVLAEGIAYIVRHKTNKAS